MSDHARLLDAARRPMPRFNAMGTAALVGMELRRFLGGWQYAILAPVLTTLLFVAIFALALGDARAPALGLPFFVFLGPGLVAMTGFSTAFEAAGWSAIDAKVMGAMDVLLAAPLRPVELVAGFVVSALLLALLNGLLVALALQAVVPAVPAAPFVAFAALALGCVLFAVIGLLAGLWASKFDQVATVQNFLVSPAVFLSGAFFPVADYPAPIETIMHGNPAFWAVDGVRRGMTGMGAAAPLSLVALAILVVLALAFCRHAVAAGWKLKR